MRQDVPEQNSPVVVRVNGVDRITLTGLSGATTGNQRYLVAGIDRYDGNSNNAPVTLFHSQLWATTLGWPGDGTAANQTLERYTGRWDKKLDTSSGLIEMGARPYDPALGRFCAVDPVEGGALNAYDYAYQDPASVYDLDGLAPIGEHLAGTRAGITFGPLPGSARRFSPKQAQSAVKVALSQLAKRRLAKQLGGIPRSAQPVAQGGSARTGRWWEYRDSNGKPKIVVEHVDRTVHVGIPKPQSRHRSGGAPKFYDYGNFGHIGE